MKLKSYFSGTVEAAMELARKELGEEALLVNARPATPETRHLGAYEVVFGAPTAGVGRAPGSDRRPTCRQDVADMRREIERLAQSLGGARMFADPTRLRSARKISELYRAGRAMSWMPTLAQAVAQGHGA